MDFSPILEAILQHSVWAAAIIYLYHFEVTGSRAREERYHDLINRLIERIDKSTSG